MKKFAKVLLVVMLVMSMVTPVFAANDFVGSIDVKPSPELAPVGSDANVYGVVTDANGNPVLNLGPTEIIVTPISGINSATHLTQTEKDIFHDVYGDLKDGDVELKDIDGLTESVKDALGNWAEAHHMVVRDVFDVKIVGQNADAAYDHLENGGKLTVKFAVSIPTGDHVEVMSYADTEWQLALDVTNNGSSLAVVFNHLCPVAILVDNVDGNPGGGQGGGEGGQGGSGTPETGDNSQPLLWGGICVAAAAGLLIALKARKKEA